MTERCKLYQNHMVLLRWQALLNRPRSDSMCLNLNVHWQRNFMWKSTIKKRLKLRKILSHAQILPQRAYSQLRKVRVLVVVCLSFLWTCQLPRRRWGVVGEQVGNPGRTLGAVSLGLISPRAPCQSVGLESVKLSWVDWSILIFS